MKKELSREELLESWAGMKCKLTPEQTEKIVVKVLAKTLKKSYEERGIKNSVDI